MPESQPLHLFDLPVDLLSLILQPLLTAPNGGIISLCPCTASPINPIPIFLIHPSLYAIAHPIFYGPANTFVLDLTEGHASHVRRFIENAAEDLPGDAEWSGRQQTQNHILLRHTGGPSLLLSQEARRRVHRLEMRIDKLRGWLWDELGSFLQDMAVRGDLSDLSLLVDYSTETKERSKSISRAFLREKKTMFEKPPLEGLVRLLADPSIRMASLRVKGRHDRAWCDFHQGGDCILKSFMRVRDGCDDATKKEDEEVVEIDWREILRVVDPEAKRRAVGWHAEM
ncbi:uncharacterized protein TrAFT101_005723 [Trichoderma asperellum]|uniref:Uncharacterized protein n=1 Tax=Trichoderma asperellum (strain ATCC 204424 / CBS 433.97 / NBRC 101777) TaxID=1042311 RepID=A0A2T3Z6V0_TRIA4|nr:hypothetical protein M441DRAFT_80040 [Trichoderma asperellum CBS 433.97]PTB40543.1 hypothetical protein M441DRAFT_80040 [Trichoderma asperellum CBS 433.97]UKZ90722.1 hypothetical protein TrAFT101_005723 [Trichoderma asperellum]